MYNSNILLKRHSDNLAILVRVPLKMKKLYLVRHAKSSWKNHSLKDFDRPLNNRGERDAPFMGELLNKQGIKPGIIVSSSAVRAYETAKIFAEKFDYPEALIFKERSVYEADALNLLDIIRDTDDEYLSLMLLGHNPGMTYLSNYLTAQRIDNMPTCSVATIEFDVDSWRKIKPESGELTAFEYPKKYLK